MTSSDSLGEDLKTALIEMDNIFLIFTLNIDTKKKKNYKRQ